MRSIFWYDVWNIGCSDMVCGVPHLLLASVEHFACRTTEYDTFVATTAGSQARSA